MTTYNKDIVSDFLCPINGTSDCTGAWNLARAFMAGRSAGDVVNISGPGIRYEFDSGTAGVPLCVGVLGGLTVNLNFAPGAILSGQAGKSGYFLAKLNVGQTQDFSRSARIASAAPGATSLRLLNIADKDKYVVGQWLAVTGINTQDGGAAGSNFPGNFAFNNFTQIGDISSSGVISISPPLQDAFLSTWPSYDPGFAFAFDIGGPATIFGLDVPFDIDLTVNGSPLLDCDGGVYFSGRRGTINGGRSGVTTSAVPRGIIPSIYREMIVNSFTQTGTGSEVDKIGGDLTFNNCTLGNLIFQSMGSANNCTVNGSSIVNINGTPRRLSLDTVSADSLALGAIYGNTRSVSANGCDLGEIIDTIANSGYLDVVGSGMTMAGGVIRWAKSNGPIAVAVPGAWLRWHGSKKTQGVFQVLSVTDDGTDTVVTTSEVGSFPNMPLRSASFLDFGGHPCPSWSGRNNTGCAEAVDLSQDGAQEKPIFCYSKRNYTKATMPATAPGTTAFNLWGELQEINVNHTPAYTGSAVAISILGQTGGNILTADKTSVAAYDPQVNGKQTGDRSITQGSVSSQSGDTLGSAPGALWFCQNQNIWASRTVSGEAGGDPITTIEIIADQGIKIEEPSPIIVGWPSRAVRRHHDPDWWEKRPRSFTRQYFNELKAAEAAQLATQERAERIKSRPAKQALNRAAQEAAEAIALAKENEVELARMTAALEAARSASDLSETIRQADLAIQYAKEIQDQEDEAIALLMLH